MGLRGWYASVLVRLHSLGGGSVVVAELLDQIVAHLHGILKMSGERGIHFHGLFRCSELVMVP